MAATNIGQGPLHRAQLVRTGTHNFTVGQNTESWDSAVNNYGITVSGSTITFTKAGTYRISVSYRPAVADVWTRWYLRDAALTTFYGKSVWAGAGQHHVNNYEFIAVIPSAGSYIIGSHNDTTGDGVVAPTPASPNTSGDLWNVVATIVECRAG